MSIAANPKNPCLLFDLDGTLVDTACEFYSAVNFLRKHVGKPILPDDIIKSQVSNGARAMTQLATETDETDHQFEKYKQILLDHYINNIGTAAIVFPGLDKLIDWCEQSNLAWGIVTNKPELYATPLIKALKLEPQCLICPDHVKVSKPDPEGLLKAAEICNSPAQNCYYFGDHIRDIEAGKNAGMKTVACGWGYGRDYQDWAADFIFENTEQALNHFIQLGS